MNRLAFLVVSLLLTTTTITATPKIAEVVPSTGFTFGETRVQIRGSGFGFQNTVCTSLSPYATFPCPVKVFFGDVEVTVVWLTSNTIHAVVPGMSERVVDVRVLAAGTQVVLPNAFTFDPHAQPFGQNAVRYLVPVVRESVEGVHGSRWVTEVTAHNGSSVDLVLGGPWAAPGLPMVSPVLAPQESLTPPLFPPLMGEGAFVYVPVPLARSTAFELRVRDTSRESEGWGTEVPVVAVHDQFAGTVRLLDVPTDPRFRATLRIYGDDYTDREVMMSIYAPSGTVPIEQRVIALKGFTNSQPDAPLWPAYAAIDPISDVVRASGQPRVRIEVAAIEPPLINPPLVRAIWALLSLTNNETQQVTTITPHDP